MSIEIIDDDLEISENQFAEQSSGLTSAILEQNILHPIPSTFMTPLSEQYDAIPFRLLATPIVGCCYRIAEDGGVVKTVLSSVLTTEHAPVLSRFAYWRERFVENTLFLALHLLTEFTLTWKAVLGVKQDLFFLRHYTKSLILYSEEVYCTHGYIACHWFKNLISFLTCSRGRERARDVSIYNVCRGVGSCAPF